MAIYECHCGSDVTEQVRLLCAASKLPGTASRSGATPASVSTVQATCKNGHVATYKCVAGENEKVIGVARSDDDAAESKELRQMLGAKASLERIDAYSKWIFTLTTVVATLGVGLGAIALPKNGDARFLYAVSVVFFALALGFAAWALKPQWLFYHPHSLEDMRESAGKQIKDRRFVIGGAAICLVVALILAGFTPYISTVQTEREHNTAAPEILTIVYEVLRLDSIDIGVRGSGLAAGTGVTIELLNGAERYGVTRVAADTLGNLSVNVTTATHAAKDSIQIVAYKDNAAQDSTKRVTVHLPPR